MLWVEVQVNWLKVIICVLVSVLWVVGVLVKFRFGLRLYIMQVWCGCVSIVVMFLLVGSMLVWVRLMVLVFCGMWYNLVLVVVVNLCVVVWIVVVCGWFLVMLLMISMVLLLFCIVECSLVLVSVLMNFDGVMICLLVMLKVKLKFIGLMMWIFVLLVVCVLCRWVCSSGSLWWMLLFRMMMWLVFLILVSGRLNILVVVVLEKLWLLMWWLMLFEFRFLVRWVSSVFFLFEVDGCISMFRLLFWLVLRILVVVVRFLVQFIFFYLLLILCSGLIVWFLLYRFWCEQWLWLDSQYLFIVLLLCGMVCSILL